MPRHRRSLLLLALTLLPCATACERAPAPSPGPQAAAPQPPKPDRRLNECIDAKDYEGLKRVIAEGVPLDAFDDETGSALGHAAGFGDAQACAILLEAGASPNADASAYGGTPLHVAGSPAVVDVLLQHGANIEATYSDGITPLHLAAQIGNIEVVKHLLTRGADPCHRLLGRTVPVYFDEVVKDVRDRSDAQRAAYPEISRLLHEAAAAKGCE